jgi:hypothetical protein
MAMPNGTAFNRLQVLLSAQDRTNAANGSKVSTGAVGYDIDSLAVAALGEPRSVRKRLR